ncbi:FAD-binding oxidoreductase [Microvirga makkahensis]|nr:FAD-binding oxidoreductase [Microvirga makkahensis]
MKKMGQDTISRLGEVLGPSGLLVGTDITERYSRDWSGDYHCAPSAVLRPSTVDEVAGALRICRDAGLSVIPQGGHTGLVGGGTPDCAAQLVLSLERLNRIRAIDPLGMTMTVEAGCILQDVKDAAAAQGVLFPLALGAQGSCQIGGNIATNAGGLNVLRYGMMRRSVLGLEVVLPDGRILSDLRALHKNNTGLDLKQLFVGTEGTLGVITAATLRLYPQPKHIETVWLCCNSVDRVMDLYALFQHEAGDFLSAFELITAPCLELAFELDDHQSISKETAQYPAHALVEISSSGGPDLKEWVEDLIAVAFERDLAADGFMAQSDTQAKSFWRIRELMVEAQQRRGLHLRSDVSVPISSMAPFIAKVTEVLSAELPGLNVLSYGHVGDGNVHVNALPPEGLTGSSFQPYLPLLVEKLNEVVDSFDGSISAEHGIGLSKRAALDSRLQGPQRELVRAVKQLLDPTDCLAPGRILVP